MKGLLTKDLILIKAQMRSILIILFCGLMMAFTLEPSIVIGYLSIIGTMSAIGTISYDEFDNGYSFLFTLPVSRKTYVREKYLLSVLAAVVFALISSLITVVLMAAKGQGNIMDEVLPTASAMIMVAAFFISFTLPIKIKYNAEKSRTMTYIIYAVILVAVFGGTKLLEMMNVDLSVMPQWLVSASPAVILAVLACIVIAVLLISERISQRIIAKKEY